MHYDVKLRPYFKKDQERDEINKRFKTKIEDYQAKGSFVFYGNLEVTINILHPTTNLKLNSSRSILYLYGSLMKNGMSDIYSDNLKYDATSQHCVLYFNDMLLRGNYTLKITFLNAINNTENIISPLNNIQHQTKFEQNGWPDAIHFQAIGARRLFPCWDNPKIRATFRISIIHDQEHEVFSNMPIQKVEVYIHEENEKEIYMWTSYFIISPAISTDVVTLVITPTPFSYFRTEKIIFWQKEDKLHKNIQYALMVTKEIMSQYEVQWGKLKIPVVQFVAICGLLYDNYNWGLVLNRETNIMYDENLHSVAHKIKVARLIGRGTIYQWFGNLINPLWSSYLWFIDGLVLFAIDAIHAIEGYKNSEMLNLFIVQNQFESLRLDIHLFMEPLIAKANPFEINSLTLFSRYIKAPLILRMLQHLVTGEVFRKSIYQYLNEHEYSTSSTPDDFWTIMQTAIDDSYELSIKQHMFPITMIIDPWTRYKGYPVLKITRNYSESSVNIAVENYNTYKDHVFWIPVTCTSQIEPNFENLKHPIYDRRLILMRSNQQPIQVTINDDGWLIFNLQQIGYYRVNYDSENWLKIAKYLNSNEYTKIHVLNRAKIIDDAFYFMVEQQLDSSIFWNLTSYFARETNYIAWYPMIKIFEYMSSVYPFSNKEVQNIKDKINEILRGLLGKIKYEENSKENDLIKCLRQEAIKWACILDDLECLEKAYDKLLEHIEKPETNKLLPWWKEWIYCKGLISANSSIWHKVVNISISKDKINRSSEFLACASNKIMDEYLELIMLKENEDLSEIDIKNRLKSFLVIIAKHAKYDNVLSNILRNFNKLISWDTNGIAIFIVIVNHVNSKEQLDEIRKFTENIIQSEVYKNYIKNICKKKKIFFDKATFDAYFHKYKNLVAHSILYAEHKLQMRLSEIERQMSYLEIISEKKKVG
ncbi:glutamyl aminopeptidase-like isoform X2 [Cataglyphis hispanica]|nr:glutamyl aminopeptidase-like isoform X2 [Cataglyphis hispanica]